MARGINKVILVGNLGKDPETRYMPSGSAVTNLTLATSESWKDKQTGDQQERTEWHKVAMFGRLAEIAAEYLRKGSQVYIEGKLRTRKWQDKEGKDRYTTEIVADEMQMLGSKGGGAGAGAPSSGLPTTSTVSSRPSMNSSTSASPNSAQMASTFAVSAARSSARDAASMPSESPACAGFTKSGKRSPRTTAAMSRALDSPPRT